MPMLFGWSCGYFPLLYTCSPAPDHPLWLAVYQGERVMDSRLLTAFELSRKSVEMVLRTAPRSCDSRLFHFVHHFLDTSDWVAIMNRNHG